MTPLLTALILAQAPSFEQLEAKKVEAINKLTGFKGTYVMVSIPSEGIGIRQEVTLIISPQGRKTKLVVDATEVAESAYTAKQRWTAFHASKTYEIIAPAEGFPMPPDVPPLKPAAGQMSLTLDDLGARFATNPSPIMAEPTNETIENRKLTRYDAKTINPSTNSQVQITQWFEPTTFILRQWEIVKTTNGKVSRIKGFLVNDQINTKVEPTEFEIPRTIQATYRLIDPS
jgi:hypothetical protein